MGKIIHKKRKNIRECSIIKQAVQLDQIVKTHKPGVMFFYTGPDDAAGAMVFMRYQGLAVRYQVNLTDHAFWLGKNAFDICIGN